MGPEPVIYRVQGFISLVLFHLRGMSSCHATMAYHCLPDVPGVVISCESCFHHFYARHLLAMWDVSVPGIIIQGVPQFLPQFWKLSEYSSAFSLESAWYHPGYSSAFLSVSAWSRSRIFLCLLTGISMIKIRVTASFEIFFQSSVYRKQK